MQQRKTLHFIGQIRSSLWSHLTLCSSRVISHIINLVCKSQSHSIFFEWNLQLYSVYGRVWDLDRVFHKLKCYECVVVLSSVHPLQTTYVNHTQCILLTPWFTSTANSSSSSSVSTSGSSNFSHTVLQVCFIPRLNAITALRQKNTNHTQLNIIL